VSASFTAPSVEPSSTSTPLRGSIPPPPPLPSSIPIPPPPPLPPMMSSKETKPNDTLELIRQRKKARVRKFVCCVVAFVHVPHRVPRRVPRRVPHQVPQLTLLCPIFVARRLIVSGLLMHLQKASCELVWCIFFPKNRWKPSFLHSLPDQATAQCVEAVGCVSSLSWLIVACLPSLFIRNLWSTHFASVHLVALIVVETFVWKSRDKINPG